MNNNTNFVRAILLHLDRGDRSCGNRYAKIIVNVEKIDIYGDHRIYVSGKLHPVRETMEEITQKLVNNKGYLPEEEDEV